MEVIIFIVGASILAGIIYACIKTGKIGDEKYDMKLVRSRTFLAVVAFVLFGIAGLAFSAEQDQALNALVSLAIAFSSLGFSVFKNVKKSNFLFGSWFTFVQALITMTIVAVIAFIIYGNSRNKSSWLSNN